MNTSKSIDISKSFIVGLKAELLKKQEEVKRLKELQQGNAKPDIIQKKKSVQKNSNEGVQKRQAKDNVANDVDFDALQKSREVLEAKSRLYDKLKANTVDEETKSKYLIDFDLKREINKESLSKDAEEDRSNLSVDEEDYTDSNSDPENDWVDFVDTLGRSRRCLRKDLPQMKEKDAKLSETLRPPSPPPDAAPMSTPTPELLSWDMQREIMRHKWEEQETLLLGKKDIHYQDVRFDEARPHGVGYFEFSTDEAERARQQEELMKMRAHTKEQQEAAEGLRMRREQQLKARLAAARRRRRERLGLPPESPPHEDESPTTNDEEEQKKCVEEESIIDLEESVKKIAPIRPWDIGKNSTMPVMSQEEWIEKKRKERPEEFAPPSNLIETRVEANQKWKSNPNIFTTKKENKKLPFNEKLKRKQKVLKSEKIKSSDKMLESGEESFGPSVMDWKCFTDKNNSISSDELPKTTRQRSNQNLPIPSTLTLESNKDMAGPSVKPWKPTVTDIDVLLSKSRAASLSTMSEPRNITQISLPESVNTMETPTTDSNFSVQNTNSIKLYDCNVSCPDSDTHVKKRDQSFEKYERCESIIKPIVNLAEVDSDGEVERCSKDLEELSEKDKWKSNKRKFAEIPPPPSMAYYIDGSKKGSQNISTKPQIADSISAGLNYIKSQNEEKSKKRLKGMLEII